MSNTVPIHWFEGSGPVPLSIINDPSIIHVCGPRKEIISGPPCWGSTYIDPETGEVVKYHGGIYHPGDHKISYHIGGPLVMNNLSDIMKERRNNNPLI